MLNEINLFMISKYLMNKNKSIFLFILLIISNLDVIKSQTAIALCPQQSTFSSMVRGYHFTAPCNFTICGLYIPTDASSGLQSVAVVRFNSGPPPAYTSTTNNFAQLFYEPNWPTNSMIPCNITVNTGDIIGVYGARSSSMVNSYGQAQCMTTILGNSVMLQRSGMQYNLSSQAMHDIWSEVGPIGRIFMYINCCPTADFTVSTPVCLGDPVNVNYTGSGTAGVTTFNWNFANASPSTANTIGPYNITWSSPGTYNVSLSVSQNNCTMATNTQQVTVNPIPTANAGTDVSICQGENTVLSASGGNSFNWSNGVTTPTVTVSPVTTTTYTVTVSGAGGCSDSDQVVVTVNSLPNANAGNDVTLCMGESTTLTATGGGTYLWSNQSTNSSIAVSPNTTTSYTVTVTSVTGCTASDGVNVTVNPIPVVNAGNDVSICAGENTVLSASGGNTYSWSTGGSNASETVSPTNTTTYTVTAYSSIGCSASDNVVVTVNPIPSANAGTDQNLCMGSSVNLSASGGAAYLWNTTPAQTTSQINVSPIQTTTYTVSVADLNGCSASDDVIVSVYTSPPVNAGNDTSTCSGIPITISATGGTIYLWSNGETNASISVVPQLNTTYTVTVSDNNGCSGTDDIVVSVNPQPVISITPQTANLCYGDSIMITASGGNSYSWSPSLGLSNTSIANPVASPLNNTIYVVTAYNQYGCSSTESVNINVEPYPTLTITPNTASLCSGNSLNISASGASTYSWSPSTGLSSSSGANVVASPLQTTTYTLTGISNNGCVSTSSYIVEVLPSPQINFSANIISGCSPLTVNFSDLSTGNIVSCLWNFGDPSSGSSNISSSSSASHTFNQSGNYDISLEITDDNGCVATMTNISMIEVYPNPVASFIMLPNIGSMDQPTISFIDQSINATNWMWNFGDPLSGNLNYSVLPNATHTYSAPGEYDVWLTVVSSGSCIDSTVNRIIIQDSYTLWAPSAFTPNGDGINEFFIPKGSGIDPDNFKLYIFDRWGKEIYYTESINNPWDGTIQQTGVIAPQGVYVWVLYSTEQSGIEHKYMGRISLIP